MLADDHELIRDALKRILLHTGRIGCVGEAKNAAETLSLVREKTWDAVILDINLPGRSGIDVLKEIKAQRPSLPVLILTMYSEDQFAVRVLRAGAAGYITKSEAPSTIVEAIERVIAGGRYITAGVAQKLAEAIGQPSSGSPHETLSDRENEIFRRIARGETVSEIAAALHLSVKTVSGYRANALRKLGVHNNAQLMRYAHDHALID